MSFKDSDTAKKETSQPTETRRTCPIYPKCDSGVRLVTFLLAKNKYRRSPKEQLRSAWSRQKELMLKTHLEES